MKQEIVCYRILKRLVFPVQSSGVAYVQRQTFEGLSIEKLCPFYREEKHGLYGLSP